MAGPGQSWQRRVIAMIHQKDPLNGCESQSTTAFCIADRSLYYLLQHVGFCFQIAGGIAFQACRLPL